MPTGAADCRLGLTTASWKVRNGHALRGAAVWGSNESESSVASHQSEVERNDGPTADC